MRAAVIFAILLWCGGGGFAANTVGETRLKGALGERLNAMIERQLNGADIDYLTAPFLEKAETKGGWQTEFWGKWMHAAMPYLAYAPSEKLRAAVERGLDRILASQEECGYIGNYPEALRCGEGWDVWGIKYTLMGLLHYYDYGGDEDRRDRALAAAKRLCDYVIGELGPRGRRGRELWETGYWSGYASSSILEPVVWLYRRTQERKYLDFAAVIVEGMANPKKGPRLVDLALRGVSVADRNEHGGGMRSAVASGNWAYVLKEGRGKAYEMMSCYQGLLDYAEEMKKLGEGGEKGWEDWLRAAVMSAEDIAKEEVNLAGGCAAAEAWFHGAHRQRLAYQHLQETCVTTTWMRFCEKLLEVTGDPKWADQLERTFYNAYLAALKSDGSAFAAYTPLSGSRWHGMHHCYMHTNCCAANGPRGFLCFLKGLFRREGNAATFNFYASALVPGFDMYTLYPRENTVRIVSHTAGSLELRLRIPGWSQQTTVRVNGEAQPGVKAGSYFTCSREWRLGDVVELKFDMPVVSHVEEDYVAFTRGPILLARDSRFHDGDLTEPFRAGMRNAEVMPSFTAVRVESDAFGMAFSAVLPLGSHSENPEAALPSAVTFCDYASAGNSWRQGDYYRTWFPIEHTPATR